jgi:MFS family permease
MKTIDPSLVSRLRALPRPAWILFFGIFLNKFGTFVMPFLTLYLTQRGFSLREAGLAMSAYGLGSVLAGVIGGVLADKIGRRKTIALSMFSVAAAMLLLSQARSLGAIMAAAWLAALTGELYRPASNALLADLTPAELRVTAYAAYRLAFNAGFAFGPAAAGLLAARNFSWLFAGDAATSVLFGLVAWLGLPRGWPARRAAGSGWGDLKALARDGRLRRLLGGAFVIGLVFLQITSTFSLHLARLGFAASTYGLILSLNGVLVVLCELPLTSWTGRFPARRVIAAGYVLIGIGFSLNAFAGSLPVLVAGVVIFTFGEMAAMPMTSASIAGLAPEDLRGRYMGAYSLTWSAALMVAPTLGMWLFGVAPGLLWLTSGGAALLAAAVVFPFAARGADQGPSVIWTRSEGRSHCEKAARTAGAVKSK